MHPYVLIFTTTLMILLKIMLFNFSLVFAQEIQKVHYANDCGYYMCEHEKENISTIIIEYAKTCQTLIFGEIHDSVIDGDPAPVNDSLYVITLLSKLKEIGYEYLALEVNKNPLKGSHSYDIVRFYETYKKEKIIQEKQYPNAKPGWIELLREAIDIGYKTLFIDVTPKNKEGSFTRDRAMFEEIKREIFDKNEKTKVIVYVGANHISENEYYTSISLCKEKSRPLGNFLDKYTKGKNFSVYMGHTYDTPMGCDLFISYFIWNKYQKKNTSSQSP